MQLDQTTEQQKIDSLQRDIACLEGKLFEETDRADRLEREQGELEYERDRLRDALRVALNELMPYHPVVLELRRLLRD